MSLQRLAERFFPGAFWRPGGYFPGAYVGTGRNTNVAEGEPAGSSYLVARDYCQFGISPLQSAGQYARTPVGRSYRTVPDNSARSTTHQETRSIVDYQPPLYLTFDDGPTGPLTSWILNVLKQYNARATFFCLGRLVEQNPDNYRAILDVGHTVGQHTYNHLRGWTTANRQYFEDIKKAAQKVPSSLFRPPYGQIRPSQVVQIKKDYHIVLWDQLSRDYDPRLSPKTILSRLQKRLRPGSIVVFHDSQKAESNLKAVLPQFLAYCKGQGYRFEGLR